MDQDTCYICIGDHTEKGGFLDSACKCSGTMKIHLLCLARMIFNKDHICGTCKTGFAPLMHGKRVDFHKRGTQHMYISEVIQNEKYTFPTYDKNGAFSTYFMSKDDEIKLSEGTYVHNKTHGLFRAWNLTRKGKYFLKQEINYDMNVMNGPYKTFYPNGTINELIIYIKGKKHGEYIRRYENNIIMQKCTYVHGKINGPFESYYPNGNKDIVCSYLYGKLHGDYYKYNVSGVLKNSLIYNNGNIQSAIKISSTPEEEPVLPAITSAVDRFNTTFSTGVRTHARRNSI